MNNSGSGRRHEAVYRVLATEAAIILRYFTIKGVLDGAHAEKLFSEKWIPILQKLVEYNSHIGQDSDPVRVFFNTLQQGIGAKSLTFADDRNEYEKNTNSTVGFWDNAKEGKKLFVDPDRAYQFVKNQYDRMGLPFAVAPAQLWQLIANKNLSEFYVRKDRNKPKPLKEIKIGGVQVKMLVLRWDEVQKFLGNY